jgi:UDP-N-acetylmuramate dehydrogenase
MMQSKDASALKGVLRLNEPLAPYTSWRIGGPAKRYYRPTDVEDLLLFLSLCEPREPLTWLGLGSNVLIADEGVSGTLIHTLGMKSVPILREGELVKVAAGVPCAKLAKYCAKEGLQGGAFFAGIPGTVGGALAMNAGAFGGETWDRVVGLEVTNHLGERRQRGREDYQVGYRKVIGPPHEWFLGGQFRFEAGTSREEKQPKDEIAYLLRMRNETQPIGVLSCGSVFQNPPNHYAARLIEASGLKGFSIGGAMISPKHANFIINTGNATAKDVCQLIQHIMKCVWQDHQIRLEPEVRIIGAFQFAEI